MPVGVTGSSYEKVGHAEYGPFDPITILRSAPGDASGVALEKTDVITRKVNWSASQGAEGSSTSKIKVDIGVSKGPVKSGVYH